MTWIAVAVVGGSIIGGGISAIASHSAANTQAAAANKATDTQLQMFNTVNQQQQPWRQAGQTSLGAISGGFGLPGPDGSAPTSSGGVPLGFFNHQFNAEDLNANLAPGYEFAKQQGQGAVTNQANAIGGLGGNSLAEISKWTTGFAQQGYQQAYQNYTQNQSNIYNRLASIAGLGQTAGSASATGAPYFASGISNTIQGAGNAQAAGQVGVANAVTGAANNAMGWYALNNMNSPFAGGSASGATGP